MKKTLLLALIPLFIGAFPAMAQEEDQSFAVEYYYRVKWGHFDEFLALYKKNHYPILKRLQDEGIIVDQYAAYPVNHASENSRWDFRYTIVYKDVAAAHGSDPEWREQTLNELYPDRETFDREEQRRFSLLLEHTDIPIWRDDLDGWKTTP